MELTRILLVEDDPDIQVVAAFALSELGGMTVETCDSGQQALARAEAFRPDLIAIDVMMPGMDGPSTLRALRATPATAPIPAVFMTARVQAEDIAAYRALGAIGVIGKPFDPVTLAAQFRALWQDWCRESGS